MKKVVERNSPLLCLVLLYRLGIIRYYDAELAYTPHGDVDVALMKKGRPFIAYDVKNSFSGETEKAIERIKAFGILRAGLVGVLEDPPPSEDSIGPERLVEIAEEVARRASEGNSGRTELPA